MSWEHYYEQGGLWVSSFGEKQKLYTEAVGVFLSDGDMKAALDKEERVNILLGGFYPHNKTPQQFKRFSDRIFKNHPHQIIYLDKNTTPFKAIEGQLGVQADLVKLPFSRSSMDFIFLDGTLNFISQSDLMRLSVSLSGVLKEHGMVFANTMIGFEADSTKEIRELHKRIGVESYFRVAPSLVAGLYRQRLVYLRQREDWTMMAFKAK